MNPGAVINALWGVLGALLPLFAGVGLAEYWEHRPAGDPSWAHLDVLFIHLAAPESLAAQRDAARHGLLLAQQDEAKLEKAIGDQDTSLAVQIAAGSRARAAAEDAIQRHRGAAEQAAARLRVIGRPLTGDGVCDRIKDADAKLVEALR